MAVFKKARLLAAIAAVGFAFAGSPALAKEVFHPFVKDEFYLARGGTPATPEQVANDPMSVFRSKVAYDAFRAHVSGYLGRTLDDVQFRALLRSDRIRLVPCEGPINTAGVTDSGRIGQRVRECYRGEMNIELELDDGRFVVVGSQACWNIVYGKIPYAPIVVTENRERLRVVQRRDRPTLIPSPLIGSAPVMVQGFFAQNCCCPPNFVPGFIVPGSNQQLQQQPARFYGLEESEGNE